MFKTLKKKGVLKPLITTYLPSYNPENDPKERVLNPWKIDFKEFTNDKQVLFIPSNIDNFNTLIEPINAKFYSAHFAFTSGLFVKEVPHDPQLYFTGEEMSITLRAYTYGYSLFHPHILIAWHEYTRKNRNKHWDDHNEWWKIDKHSKNHYLSIFDNIGGHYGLGKERTIEDYIKTTGFNFLDYKVEDNANLKYKQFDDNWSNWIKENIELGCSKTSIVDILLKANFDPNEIEKQFILNSKSI